MHIAFLLDFNAYNKDEHNTKKKEIQLTLKIRKVESACLYIKCSPASGHFLCSILRLHFPRMKPLKFLRLHNYHFSNI